MSGREAQEGGDICVVTAIYVVVQQEVTQHCKAVCSNLIKKEKRWAKYLQTPHRIRYLVPVVYKHVERHTTALVS